MDVSVIIPTYNRADLIGYTLEAIRNQTEPMREVIVVDDGSTDDTEAVVRAHNSLNVRYFRLENGGPSRARNFGVRQAQARWIAFCDSDDLWKPDYLARHRAIAEAFPEVKLSFSNSTYVVDGVWGGRSKFDEAPSGFWDAPAWRKIPGGFISSPNLIEKFLTFQPVYPSTVVIDREYFECLGGYNERFSRNPAEDTEFTWRCVRSATIAALADPLVGMRKHSSNFSGNALRTSLGVVEILDHALQTYGLDATARAVAEHERARGLISAFNSAFSMRRFDLACEVFTKIPVRGFPLRLYAKAIIATVLRPVLAIRHSAPG